MGRGIIARKETRDFIVQVQYIISPIKYGPKLEIKNHVQYIVSIKPKDYESTIYRLLRIPASISSDVDDRHSPFLRPVAISTSSSDNDIMIRLHESIYNIP